MSHLPGDEEQKDSRERKGESSGEVRGSYLLAALARAAINTPDEWRLNRSTGTLGYVPEPTTVALVVFVGLALMRRRRRT